jgi:ribosomal protein S27AE
VPDVPDNTHHAGSYAPEIGRIVAMFHEQVDRDNVDGDAAARAAMRDAYLERGRVRVTHVLVVGGDRDWYGPGEGVIEIDRRYVDQDGYVLGDDSDCERRTWVVGEDCLVVVADGTGTRVAPGDGVTEDDILVAVVCPRCGGSVSADRDRGLMEAGLVECGRCWLEIETASIAANWE